MLRVFVLKKLLLSEDVTLITCSLCINWLYLDPLGWLSSPVDSVPPRSNRIPPSSVAPHSICRIVDMWYQDSQLPLIRLFLSSSYRWVSWEFMSYPLLTWLSSTSRRLSAFPKYIRHNEVDRSSMERCVSEEEVMCVLSFFFLIRPIGILWLYPSPCNRLFFFTSYH